MRQAQEINGLRQAESAGFLGREVSMSDFFPPYKPTMEDFFPGGKIEFAGHKVLGNRKLGPDAGAVIQKLADRLICSSEAEIELLTIMEFCHRLLKNAGVKMPEFMPSVPDAP